MREFKDDFQDWLNEPKQKECLKHNDCSKKCSYYKECSRNDIERSKKAGKVL